MKNLSLTVLSLAIVGTIAACASEDGDGLNGAPGGYDNGSGATGQPGAATPGDGVTPGDGTPVTPSQQCTDLNRKYVGLGGEDLGAARLDEFAGVNRARVKPYSSLEAEYARVLGVAPELIKTSGASFGEPQARWSQEPQGSALTTYQGFRIAFIGCLNYTKDDAKYAAAPVDATASAVCAEFERKFWSRTPDASEIDACKQVAVTDSAKESVAGAAPTDTDPRRRWAYTCATVLSAAGFTSY